MSSHHVISIDKLTKRFSNFVALDSLSLDVGKGSCVGFLGPNGAGKSTTIKILSGLIKPSSGSARISGFDVQKESRDALATMGVIVETPYYYHNFTPRDILSYFGKLRGIQKSPLETQLRKVLNFVKLDEWSDNKIGTFSKGMRQRVAIASILLHDPDVIIVDEVTSGLDPRGQIEVMRIFDDLKKQGKTIFMSSHNVREAQQLCDFVALIDKGVLLKYDKISNIGSVSKNSRVSVEFFRLPDDFKSDSFETLSNIVEYDVLGNSAVFTIRGGKKERAILLKELMGLGLMCSSFHPIGTDLETLYMDMVNESVR